MHINRDECEHGNLLSLQQHAIRKKRKWQTWLVNPAFVED